MLPWEYGVRNLFRRPLRSGLTLLALTTVILLIFVVLGFIRGLEQSLAVSGDPQVVLVYSVNAAENLDNSAISARTPELLAASVAGTTRRFGLTHASPELYLGTRVSLDDSDTGLGLVRGVESIAPMVRRSVRIVEGDWPGPGEVMVGKLASTKLGVPPQRLGLGQSIEFEGRTWTVSGRFTAAGAAYESEIWCPLTDLQSATKRQDISLAALLLTPQSSPGQVQLFCTERLDLELAAIPETRYYESLQQHYKPVRMIAWIVVLLVSGSGVFAGLNMMYGAVAGRVREFAALQAVGFRRRAIVLSLIQEAVLLAATGSLLAGLLALTMINGLAVRFTMGAFTLRIDGTAMLIGCSVGLFIGVCGAIPPAIRALRLPVAVGLKAI